MRFSLCHLFCTQIYKIFARLKKKTHEAVRLKAQQFCMHTNMCYEQNFNFIK